VCSKEVGVRTTSDSVLVPASPAAVWAVLTDPALTRSCLLGLAVDSTFEVGSEIAFRGPAGMLVGGRVLAHDEDALLTHSLGDLCPDLVRAGLQEHDPSCWVTWTAEVISADPPVTRVMLTVDAFDPDEEPCTAWSDALEGLARVLEATQPG
jgi:hypothetical protein